MPLSQRSSDKPAELGPYEGVPEWLKHSLTQWCLRRFRQWTSFGDELQDHERLNRVERKLKLKLPTANFNSRLAALINAAHADPVLFLDLVDLLLSEIASDRRRTDYDEAAQLARYLEEAGSIWRVVERRGVFALEQRLAEELAQAAEQVLGVRDRPGQLLRRAWQAVYGRHKDAGIAYREAVRAVEAVAKPVILPDSPRATLGTMIAAIRDAPEKWEFVLQPTTGDSVSMVRTTMELLWTAQLDRHGTDDESAPLSVSDLEAETAVHLALTLVHWFRIRAFRRKE